MRFFLPEGTLTRALFNISTWAVTQASNKLERGSDKAAQLGDDNISTAGNKKVPDGRNCIYEEVDFVSDNLCSYLFHPLLYLWGKHLHPWLWHAYTPPPFTCPLFTSSHHLPSMSYPQPQEDTAIKGWQCHWRQWPETAYMLIVYVSAGPTTHLPTVLKVTGFSESIIITARKCSYFPTWERLLGSQTINY